MKPVGGRKVFWPKAGKRAVEGLCPILVIGQGGGGGGGGGCSARENWHPRPRRDISKGQGEVTVKRNKDKGLVLLKGKRTSRKYMM